MKTTDTAPQDKHGGYFTEKELLELEDRFVRQYYTGDKRHPVRTLLRLYKGYYRKLIVCSFCYLIKDSPSLLLPVVTAEIMDLVVGATTGTVALQQFWQRLAIYCGAMIGLFFLNIPFHYMYIHNRSIASRTVEAGLRGAVVKKLQRLTIRCTSAMRSGRIHSKIIRDVDSIHGLFDQLVDVTLSVVFNLAVLMTVIIVKGSWEMLLFYLLCVPVTVFISRRFTRRFSEKNRSFRKELEKTSSQVGDMVEMLPVTRAHALEDTEVERMNRRVGRLADRGLDLDHYIALFGSANWCTIQFFSLVCLAFTGIMAVLGRMTIGEMNLYTNYFARFLAIVNTVLGMIPNLAAGSEAIASVGEILGSADEERNEEKEAIGYLRGEYDFRHVTFGYEEDRPVLQGLDLHVAAGETIALVGESGSGKTTILNLVTGFYLPQSGSLTVDGSDIGTIDLDSYRRHIAMVPQTSTMFSATVRENITYGLDREVSDEELARVLEAACLTDVVAALPDGADTVIGEKGCDLSGGQRQRVSIARAIIRDPSVIIFDEATSALDTVSEQKIQLAIENMSRYRTTFIVAHRLSTIRNADKIAVIHHGRCVEYGTYDELVAKGEYFYRLRSLQI